VTGRIAGQFGGRAQPGLGHDIVLVEVDGSGRKVQDRRNLLDDLALSPQLQTSRSRPVNPMLPLAW